MRLPGAMSLSEFSSPRFRFDTIGRFLNQRFVLEEVRLREKDYPVAAVTRRTLLAFFAPTRR